MIKDIPRADFAPPEEEPTEPEIIFSEIINGEEIDKIYLPLPAKIISGILSRGEKGELAGGSKSFKTWALIHQALAVAAGLDWWGFKNEKNNVIFLNLEIPPAFFEARVRAVANALGIKIPKNFHVWHLRNAKLGEAGRWAQFLATLKARCSAIPNPFLTSDPIYKLLGGRNENSAGDVALLLEQLDDMVELSEGANFFGHHFAKGHAGSKDPIDRAGGSGVFQRDPDTILMMTPHQNDGCFTVDAILRNHPPIENFVIEWKYPRFVRSPGLNQALKQPRQGGQAKYNVGQLYDWLGKECLRTAQFARRLKEETGMGATKFYELLKRRRKAKAYRFRRHFQNLATPTKIMDLLRCSVLLRRSTPLAVVLRYSCPYRTERSSGVHPAYSTGARPPK